MGRLLLESAGALLLETGVYMLFEGPNVSGTLWGIRFDCSLDEQWNEDKQRRDYEHSAVYVIEMDDEEAREDDVDAVAGCPQIGDSSTVVSGAVCTKRSFKEIGPRVWEVTATYKRIYSGTPDEAWRDYFRWSWSFETVDEPMLYDAEDGSAIVNSAGEGLPPLAVPISIPVLTIKKYEQNFLGSTILAYTNRVNKYPFWGAGAGKALCAGIGADQIRIDDVDLWQVSYTVKFNLGEYGWRARILDQGTYYWDGTPHSSEKKSFDTDDQKPVVGNLDGSGGKNDTSTPSFVDYARFPEVDFNVLGINRTA